MCVCMPHLVACPEQNIINHRAGGVGNRYSDCVGPLRHCQCLVAAMSVCKRVPGMGVWRQHWVEAWTRSITKIQLTYVLGRAVNTGPVEVCVMLAKDPSGKDKATATWAASAAPIALVAMHATASMATSLADKDDPAMVCAFRG